jgi:hypothetical protein
MSVIEDTEDIAAIGASAYTADTGALACIAATVVSAFIEAIGLSAFLDTGATGVSVYTGATVGVGLAYIVVAAAGNSPARQRMT